MTLTTRLGASLFLPIMKKVIFFRHSIIPWLYSSNFLHHKRNLIIDDGSTDGTSSHIDSFADGKTFVKILHHKNNRGIGPALISGYLMATMENVCAIPADGQFNPAELLQVPVVSPHTIVSFYRPHKKLYSPFRKLLTYCNRFLNHLSLIHI